MYNYKQLENLTNKVNELNQTGCLNYSDYSYLIDQINEIKAIDECKLNTALTVMSEFRIDIISSPIIDKGVAKMIVNVEDLHRILAKSFDNKQQ